MRIAVPFLFLLCSAQQSASQAAIDPAAETGQIQLHGDCRYKPTSGTSAASKVRDVVRRFNDAINCNDAATAQLFVAEGATVTEIEDISGGAGQPARRVESGSLREQTFLFARPDPNPPKRNRARVVQGDATVIVDGGAALVRQPIWSESTGKPVMAACLIQHLMLAHDGHDWKIQHLTLVPDVTGCKEKKARR